MKNILLDIETFSSADLRKTGVYRYVEAEDFEILLLSYSIDGGAIQTIDLAAGEKIQTTSSKPSSPMRLSSGPLTPSLNVSVSLSGCSETAMI